MEEHETWLTALFNDHLAGLGNTLLGLFGLTAEHPDRPWANFIVMEMLVALVIVLLFAFLRPRLSADSPGKLQHFFELIYNFLKGQAEEAVGPGSGKYLPLFGTLFIFILFSNYLGVVPTFESPTMFPFVTVGCALISFLYYHMVGVQAVGVGSYLKHFLGPMPALALLMVPIEIISHLARPLSLSVRLFANVYAGEQVTLVFVGLTYFLVPMLFMVLHIFVATLQAYVFTLLTMIYVGGAVAHEEH
jgi:F-type H+-transporting ATPase subunit a